MVSPFFRFLLLLFARWRKRGGGGQGGGIFGLYLLLRPPCLLVGRVYVCGVRSFCVRFQDAPSSSFFRGRRRLGFTRKINIRYVGVSVPCCVVWGQREGPRQVDRRKTHGRSVGWSCRRAGCNELTRHGRADGVRRSCVRGWKKGGSN